MVEEESIYSHGDGTRALVYEPFCLEGTGSPEVLLRRYHVLRSTPYVSGVPGESTSEDRENVGQRTPRVPDEKVLQRGNLRESTVPRVPC